MSPERLDDLLSRSLETGVIPADATPEERRELAPLLERAMDVRLSSAAVRGEADSAMPAARARFQRHLQAQRPVAPAPLPRTSRRGFLGGLLNGRGMAFVASAASIGVIALVALAVLQPWNTPESAAALTVDDYVQVQGVVSNTNGDVVTVASPDLGNLEVALNDLTTVTDAAGVAGPLRRGDTVLVAGVVTARRAIAASAVSVSQTGATPPAGRPAIRTLKEFKAVEGTVKLVSLSPDGVGARVLLRTSTESLFVDIEQTSTNVLLTNPGGPLEARVRVTPVRGAAKGVFGLELLDAANPAPTPPGTAVTQFRTIRGVVLSRNLNVFIVRTTQGDIPVSVRGSTAIRLGDSGLSLADIRDGERIIGHEVVASGVANPRNQRGIIAEVVTVMERPGQQ